MAQRIFPALRLGTAALCAYESVSIVTRRAPTLSQLAERHRWLGPTLVIALAVHLLWPVPDLNISTPAGTRRRLQRWLF